MNTLLLSLACLLACGDPASEAPPGPRIELPALQPGSLYALDLDLVDDAGATRGLDLDRGRPTLLSMFYTSCPMACPLLIQEIQGLEAELSPLAREHSRVLLVSMDPEHDHPAALAKVRQDHGLDARWSLGTPPADRVREVAALLGIRYRPLPEGGFAHTSVLTLVDGQGRVVARSEGMAGRAELVATLEQLSALGS